MIYSYGIFVLCSSLYHVFECNCLTYDAQCKSDILSFCIKPNILVIVIYHPYWGESTFHDTVIDHIVNVALHAQVDHDVKSVYVCGDFNGLSRRIDILNSLLNTEFLFTLILVQIPNLILFSLIVNLSILILSFFHP